ncbi:MAG: hypothetical protein KC561_06545, partial [Myxococcales bacterium]|nr:hypothetical protein [Myxococcales bacterium]
MKCRHYSSVLLALTLFACGGGEDDETCTRNSQCFSGFVCDNGLCVEACELNLDCPSGEICTNGFCRPGQVSEDIAEVSDLGALDIPEVQESNAIGPDGRPMLGNAIGGACTATSECRFGLECSDDTCQPAGAADEGDLCVVSGECAEGLACGLTATCEERGAVEAGGACASPSECVDGLRCNLLGPVGVCVEEGSADAGQDCTSDASCLSPLVCASNDTCQIPAVAGVELFSGVQCEENDEDGDFRVYFELPSDSMTEFFRLPFPNDIRLTDTGMDLRGFPVPNLGVLGAEVISGYVNALENNTRGFSTSAKVYFRFSREFDFASVDGRGDNPTLRIVNITPDSPGYGRGLSYSWFSTNGSGRFICQNYVAVSFGNAAPLDPSTTYAVFLTDGVRDSDGNTPVQDEDFAAVMASERPSGAARGAAWDAYQPFRTYLSEQEIDAESIMGAAVFTTMDPTVEVAALRSSIRSRAVLPALNDIVVCGGDSEALDGCHDGETRACINPDEGFIEIHATYTAPVYQQGDRPYLTPDAGGNVIFVDGQAQNDGGEEICMSLTIPANAEMPEAGWPVLMYAHGTGGDFLSGIRNGVSGLLTNVTVGEQEVGFATVSIDGVQHGPRRGDSTLDPEVLFFNFLNPAAALGNVLQGVADYFYLTWLLEHIDYDSENSPIGEALRFDTGNMYFWGHSQGATVGVPFLAYESNVRAGLLTGAGGSLTLS